MNRITMQRIELDNTIVRYQVIGVGEPVILVHGLSASMLWWKHNVASLARHHRVYLLDLPGFGSMRHCRDRFMLDNAITWLIKWLEAMQLNAVHLIGHSMGGYICMAAAGQRPDLVKRLVLVAPAVMPHARSIADYMLPLCNTVRYLTPAFWPILFYDALRTRPLIFIQATREILCLQDVSIQMQAIKTPTLLIWGEQDFLVPVPIAPHVHSGIADARFLLLKRTGHICMFEDPHTFNQAVLAFLKGEPVGISTQSA